MNGEPGPGAMSPQQWNDQYTRGVPHWDPGRPQPAFRDLVDSGAIRGRVLDAGCGSGEHVLLCAAAGLDATGVDVAPAAIQLAGRKAAARGLAARFLVHDVHRLPALGESFDTVLDSGLLHIFADADRVAYLRSVHAVLAPGGRMYVLCFSDQQSAAGGPRRLSRDELTTAFTGGWHIDAITATNLDTATATATGDSVPCWLVAVTRLRDRITAHAAIATARAERYLEQFCRHAEQAHRIPHELHRSGRDRHGPDTGGLVHVERSGSHATLDFGWARCSIHADDTTLHLQVEADDADNLTRAQTVIVADLQRFAHREQPTVTWKPVRAPAD